VKFRGEYVREMFSSSSVTKYSRLRSKTLIRITKPAINGNLCRKISIVQRRVLEKLIVTHLVKLPLI
jgi:hypothetical protein